MSASYHKHATQLSYFPQRFAIESGLLAFSVAGSLHLIRADRSNIVRHILLKLLERTDALFLYPLCRCRTAMTCSLREDKSVHGQLQQGPKGASREIKQIGRATPYLPFLKAARLREQAI